MSTRWMCPRDWHGKPCLSQKTVKDEKGIYECRRCWAVLKPGEGNADEGAGIVPDTEEQRKALPL